MKRDASSRDLRGMLLVPSVYGVALWCLWGGLYVLRLIPWDPPTIICAALCAAMGTAYIASARVFVRHRVREAVTPAAAPVGDRWRYASLLLLHLVGLA